MGNTSAPGSGSAEAKPAYVAGGPVQAANGVYLSRSADRQLLELCKARTFAYVLTSRQMGKSSLMVRTAENLLSQGFRSVIIDLTEFGSWVSAEQWYAGIVEAIATQLGLASAGEWWRAHGDLGMSQRFSTFFREWVLSAIHEPIVIFVDEIDSTLSIAFSDDFFAAIRRLYHMRVNLPALNRLSFVLIGVASPDDLIKDASRTPFNIGKQVDLTDFSEGEVQPLVAGLNLDPLDATLFLRWVVGWTGGHPYLTLRVFRKYQEDSREWVTDETVIRQLYFGKGESPDSNLQFVRKMIMQDDQYRHAVLEAYDLICHGQVVRDDSSAAKTRLKLSGLVVASGGELRIRNRIYEEVFDLAWLGAVRGELKKKAAMSAAAQPARRELAAPAKDEEDTARKSAGRRLNAIHLTRDQLERSILLATESIQAALWREAALKSADDNILTMQAAIDHEKADLARMNADFVEAQSLFDEHNMAEKDFDFRKESYARKQSAFDQSETRLTQAKTQREQVAAQLASTQKAFEFLRHNMRLLRRQILRIDHAQRATCCAFSPDGRFGVCASDDGTARAFDIDSGVEVALGRHADRISSVAFSPNGDCFATAGADEVARVWSLRGGRLIAEVPHEDCVTAAFFSRDGYSLITASWDNSVRLWDLRGAFDDSPGSTAAVVEKRVFLHHDRISGMALNADGEVLATASWDHTVKMWDLRSGVEIASFEHSSRLLALALSPDARILATACDDRSARIWDVRTRTQIAELTHNGRVSAMAISPDGTRLATASHDRTARVWDVADGQELSRMDHAGRVSSVGFGGNGLLVTASEDGTARIWNARSGGEMGRLNHEGRVVHAAFSADTRMVISAGEDRTTRVWEATATPEIRSYTHGDRVRSLAVAGDGARLVSASDDGTARVWTAQGEEWRVSHGAGLTSASFSRDGRVVTTGEDGMACVWGPGASTIARLGHPAWVYCAAFVPEGHHVVTGCEDGLVRVWNVAEESQVALWPQGSRVWAVATDVKGSMIAVGGEDGFVRTRRVPEYEALWAFDCGRPVYCLAASPDGSQLAGGDAAGRVFLWDVVDGTLIRELRFDAAAYALAFSPDARFLMAGYADGTITIWETDTGQKVVRWHEGGPVHGVAFLSDGKLVAAAADNQIRLTIWLQEDLVAFARAHLTRNLSKEEWNEFFEGEPYRKTCPHLP